MIKIDLLKNHPDAIPALAHIWHDVLGRIWLPEISVESVMAKFADYLNDKNLPITFVALHDDIPIGMCSLRENDGIRPSFTPLLVALVVDPKYQRQGIGRMLIDVTVLKAKELGFEKLYLFAFDPTIPEYYERLGWKKIGMDEFKSRPVTVMEVGL